MDYECLCYKKGEFNCVRIESENAPALIEEGLIEENIQVELENPLDYQQNLDYSNVYENDGFGDEFENPEYVVSTDDEYGVMIEPELNNEESDYVENIVVVPELEDNDYTEHILLGDL